MKNKKLLLAIVAAIVIFFAFGCEKKQDGTRSGSVYACVVTSSVTVIDNKNLCSAP